MDIEQFQNFMENVWMRAGDPNRVDGMMAELEVGCDSCFVDGDGEETIMNIVNLIQSMRRDLNNFENAMQHVIDDGEMGL